MTDAYHAKVMVDETVHHFRRVDISISNAGVIADFVMPVKAANEGFEHTVRVNWLRAWFRCGREASECWQMARAAAPLISRPTQGFVGHGMVWTRYSRRIETRPSC